MKCNQYCCDVLIFSAALQGPGARGMEVGVSCFSFGNPESDRFCDTNEAIGCNLTLAASKERPS